MRIVLDSQVRIAVNAIPLVARGEIEYAFTYKNQNHTQLIRLKKFYAAQKEPATISTYGYDGDFMTLPRGGFRKVRNILRSHGVNDFEIDDRRVEGELREWIPDTGRSLDWFQEEAVQLAMRSQNCLVRAPTGSGKTTAAIAMISRIKRPSLVLVWTDGLKDQWKGRLRAELGLDEDQVGIYGGGKKEEADILIAMDQTLARSGVPEWMVAKYGVLICDEVQRFAARSFREVVSKFPAKYRIGLSADETRPDELECLIYDQFGSVSYEISQEAVDQTGRTVPVNVVVVPTAFTCDAKESYNRTLAMVTDHERNEVVYSLIESVKGKQVLLFFSRIEHCKSVERSLIMRGYRTGLTIGQAKNKVERERAIDGLTDGSIEIGVGTVESIGTGIDIPTVEVAIVADPIGTNLRLFNQVRGRICRGSPGKTHATIYYLWDQHVYGRYVLKGIVDKYGDRVKVLVDGRLMNPDEYRIPRKPTFFDTL